MTTPKEEDKKVEDCYKFGDVIGRGNFSIVREGIDLKNNTKWAIKTVTKTMLSDKEVELLSREIEVMEKLKHPNIVQLQHVFLTPKQIHLILEYVAGGELFEEILRQGAYAEHEAADIVRQVLEAIQYCHKQGIAHRDLKPENLLLAKPSNKDKSDKATFIKITDFGLSKNFLEERMNTAVGSMDYVAPEVLKAEGYDMAVDIWSIGVITYVLLCGYWPFHGETDRDTWDNILNGRFSFPDPEWTNVSDEAREFIKNILVVDPDKRPTAAQCLQHQWIKENCGKKESELSIGSPKTEFSTQKFKDYMQARYKKNRSETI